MEGLWVQIVIHGKKTNEEKKKKAQTRHFLLLIFLASSLFIMVHVFYRVWLVKPTCN